MSEPSDILNIRKTKHYARLSVRDYIEEFCGWNNLKAIIDYAGTEREQAFFSALFETGGRVSEVLALTKQNFILNEPKGVIIVRDMPLMKRYRKIKEIENPEETGRKWITEKIHKKRKQFPILLKEPLTPILLKWLEKTSDLLFPSPYRAGLPLTRFWAYYQIRKIDRKLPEDVRAALGLNKPFIYREYYISSRLHLWLHWFRSQRASQLVHDYGFEIMDLLNFFEWERYETALHYAKKGWRDLANKMQDVQVSYA